MTPADQTSLFVRLLAFRLLWIDTFEENLSPAETRKARMCFQLERELDSVMDLCLRVMTAQGRSELAKTLISLAVRDGKGEQKWMPTLLELLPRLDYCRRRMEIDHTRELIAQQIMEPLAVETMYQLHQMFLSVIPTIPANLLSVDKGKKVHWPSINSLNEYWRWGYLRPDAVDRVLLLVNWLRKERNLERLPEIPQVPVEFRNRPPGGLGRKRRGAGVPPVDG